MMDARSRVVVVVVVVANAEDEVWRLDDRDDDVELPSSAAPAPSSVLSASGDTDTNFFCVAKASDLRRGVS